MQLGGSGSEEVGQLSWNSEIFRNCCEIERLRRPASLLQTPVLPNSQQCCRLALSPLTQGAAIVAGTGVQASLFLQKAPLFGLQCLGHAASFFFCSRACFFVTLLIAKGQLSRLLGMLTRYSGILSHQTKSVWQQDKVLCLFTRKLQAQCKDHFLLYRNLGFRSVSLLLYKLAVLSPVLVEIIPVFPLTQRCISACCPWSKCFELETSAFDNPESILAPI